MQGWSDIYMSTVSELNFVFHITDLCCASYNKSGKFLFFFFKFFVLGWNDTGCSSTYKRKRRVYIYIYIYIYIYTYIHTHTHTHIYIYIYIYILFFLTSAFYPWERDPVPILQEAGWTPGPVWTGVALPHRDSIPGPSTPCRVVIPTELSRPTECYISIIMYFTDW